MLVEELSIMSVTVTSAVLDNPKKVSVYLESFCAWSHFETIDVWLIEAVEANRDMMIFVNDR